MTEPSAETDNTIEELFKEWTLVRVSGQKLPYIYIYINNELIKSSFTLVKFKGIKTWCAFNYLNKILYYREI